MFSRQSRPARVGMAVALLLVATTAHRATAQTLDPVSRTLHAQASAPPVVHNPPDVVVGPVFGPFTHAAAAQGVPTSASAQVDTDMNAAQLTMRVSGNVSSTFMGQVPGASGFVSSIFNLATETTFDLTLFRVGGPSSFSADASIRESGGGPVHFQQSAPFTMSPPQILLTLPAGQYEALLSGAPNHTAGTGGGGSGAFELRVVPEPAAALALLLAFPLTRLPRCRRRRRRR